MIMLRAMTNDAHHDTTPCSCHARGLQHVCGASFQYEAYACKTGHTCNLSMTRTPVCLYDNTRCLSPTCCTWRHSLLTTDAALTRPVCTLEYGTARTRHGGGQLGLSGLPLQDAPRRSRKKATAACGNTRYNTCCMRNTARRTPRSRLPRSTLASAAAALGLVLVLVLVLGC